MDAAGVGRSDLMGYSMGGRIVLELLARSPSRFSSAVVGGAGIYATMNPQLRAAVVQALETEDVSSITDPTALFFRQFAESRAHDSHRIADLNPDLKALAACFASFWRSAGPGCRLWSRGRSPLWASPRLAQAVRPAW